MQSKRSLCQPTRGRSPNTCGALLHPWGPSLRVLHYEWSRVVQASSNGVPTTTSSRGTRSKGPYHQGRLPQSYLHLLSYYGLMSPSKSSLVVSIISCFLRFFFRFVQCVGRSGSVGRSVGMNSTPSVSGDLQPFGCFSYLLCVVGYRPRQAPNRAFAFFPTIGPGFFYVFAVSSFSRFVNRQRAKVYFGHCVLVARSRVPWVLLAWFFLLFPR